MIRRVFFIRKGGWQVGSQVCPNCGNLYITVVSIVTPFEECPNCGEFHATPLHQPELWSTEGADAIRQRQEGDTQ